MDDWQETQQTTRHIHNRVNKGSKRHGGGKSGGTFDVKRTFGTYEIKCPAAEKLSTSARDGDDGRDLPFKLEVYTLTEMGNAVVGELMLGGVLHASVLLAGSRKTMNAVVRELEATDEEEKEGGEDEGVVGTGEEGTLEGVESRGDGDDDGHSDSDEDDNEDSTTNQRFREFEKNSFRSPKFWLKWQGSILSQAAGSDSSLPDQTVTSTGYIVFSGNQCDRFQGTISCEPLDWNNVKISGWKIKSQSARDFALTWSAERGLRRT